MSKISKERFIQRIKDEYGKNDVCMFDLLSIMKPNDTMTLDECFEAYCELMNWADGDAFLRVNQDNDFCKDITADREYKCSELFIA